MSINQLMGSIDDQSADWNDGVLAKTMREFASDKSLDWKWIILDSPIDPIWVENLNSVLDESKRLTLTTGETIMMNPTMSILIEAESLSNTTPATISWIGMIYVSDWLLPLKPLINKWLYNQPAIIHEELILRVLIWWVCVISNIS